MTDVNADILQIFRDQKYIDESEYESILSQHKLTNERIHKLLAFMDLKKEDEVAELRAEVLGIPMIDLESYITDNQTAKILSQESVMKYMALPLYQVKDMLTVAMVDPSDIQVIDSLKFQTGLKIQPVLVTKTSFKQAAEQLFSLSDEVEELAGISEGVGGKEDTEVDISKIRSLTNQPPVIKLVNLIISQALAENATDIHLEPQKDRMKVRIRVDGILREIHSIAASKIMPIISRIKILAIMDITETRRPQDGRFTVKKGAAVIDLRVSTFPVTFGEKIVIRILNNKQNVSLMEDLGMSGEVLTSMKRLISTPYGLLLVTGPTGSGKTTTLYSALQIINKEDVNIITLEDPREIIIPGVNQAQIKNDIDFTFASGLRSVLRQDPDVIMVGEIRDAETALIAVQASLTGHLVLSTLHTFDAPSTVLRLLNLGIDPHLVSTALIGIISQRLVRCLCPKCKKKTDLSDDRAKEIEETFGHIIDFPVYAPAGCRHCKFSGYTGRTGLYELIVIDREAQDFLQSEKDPTAIKRFFTQHRRSTLIGTGLEKVKNGITTLEELMRTVPRH